MRMQNLSPLIASGVIVGVLALIFFTPFVMARGISKLDKRSGAGNFILCMIPIVNVIRAEKIYYGRVKLLGVSSILLVIVTALRFAVWFNFYDNIILGTGSFVLFWVSVVLYAAANMIFVYTVIHDADALRGFKLFLFTIAFPFGQYYIGAYLNNVIAHNMAREDTFKR
jgi:hypothetical protein